MCRPATLLALIGWLCATIPGIAEAQSASRTGLLTAVWGDPEPGSPAAAELRWFLTDDAGVTHAVAIPESVLGSAGGIHAVDRQRVTLSGTALRAVEADGGEPELRASLVRALAPTGAASLAVTGSRPYAVLLCRFSDITAQPRPPSFFSELMGPGYPNMDHYYREISGGRMNLEGTEVFGWYELPQPRSYYVSMGTSAMLGALARDCTAAADPTVDFSVFAGIAVQVNGTLAAEGSGFAWGGSWALALDGPQRAWPFIWMPDWAMQHAAYGVYAHELGHSFRLPHSSGPYAATYDSKWDVMSDAYLHWNGTAWVPGGTISYHKTMLGWIPPSRVVTVTAPEPHTIDLGQSVFQDAAGGPLAIVIPIPGTGDFYTVEARRRLGYDAYLPGEAVIIHRVPDPFGPNCTLSRCARVVDADGNGNPNDAGAMWLSGETFNDGNGIRVAVGNATSQGWTVTVTPGNILTVRGEGSGQGTVRTQAGVAPAVACTVDGGSVSGTCTAAYYGNPTVTLAATASAGAEFSGWSGACGGTGSCTIAMSQARAVTATFRTAGHTVCALAVSAAPSAGGTVSGGGDWECGTSRTVTAEPADGYDFAGWYENDDVVSANVAYTFMITGDRSLVANFQRRSYTLTIGAAGTGTGVVTSEPAGIACNLAAGGAGGACTAAFEEGATVRLTFAPAAGTVLAEWTECTAQAASCDITMTQAATVVARALARPATLTTARVADALLQKAALSADEVEYLDTIGNRNGRLDLGDFIAWLAQQ